MADTVATAGRNPPRMPGEWAYQAAPEPAPAPAPVTEPETLDEE
jgi:hypothetical protein